MNSTFTKILICLFICVFSAKQINAQCLANETQIKINALRKQLEKIDGLKKDEDEIPF